jgi:hypothetical protein
MRLMQSTCYLVYMFIYKFQIYYNYKAFEKLNKTLKMNKFFNYFINYQIIQSRFTYRDNFLSLIKCGKI